MSKTAEEHVKACTHPDVKGATRALLQAIAEHIPEGQTTTLAMRLDDLAIRAQHTERTARTARDLLVAIGVIRVHDGGRGRPYARYEIVALTGERPLVPAKLPLLGRAKKPPQTKKQRSGSDLFSDLADPRSDPTFATSDPTLATSEIFSDPEPKVGNFFRRWWAKVGNFFRRWVQKANEQRSRSDLFSDLGDGINRGLKISSSRSEEVEDRAREPADAFLAWFERTYPTVHQGAVCASRRGRDGPLVRELLQRPHTDLPHLQAMALHLWAVTTDGVHSSDRWWIAEVVTVRDIFVLHRKADFLDLEVRRAVTAAADDDVWPQVRHRIEMKVKRHDFYTWFASAVLEHDGGSELVIATPHVEYFELNRDLVREAVREVRSGAEVRFVAADTAQRKQA